MLFIGLSWLDSQNRALGHGYKSTCSPNNSLSSPVLKEIDRRYRGPRICVLLCGGISGFLLFVVKCWLTCSCSFASTSTSKLVLHFSHRFVVWRFIFFPILKTGNGGRSGHGGLCSQFSALGREHCCPGPSCWLREVSYPRTYEKRF